MSPREGIIYGSWMAGIILIYSIGMQFGVPKIPNLIMSALLGGAISFAIEKLYLQSKEAERGDRSENGKAPHSENDNPYDANKDVVFCPKKGCDWQGESGSFVYCPKCDERLY